MRMSHRFKPCLPTEKYYKYLLFVTLSTIVYQLSTKNIYAKKTLEYLFFKRLSTVSTTICFFPAVVVGRVGGWGWSRDFFQKSW